MKVILTKDLDNLGKAGSMVEVKRGYGRNYLIPNEMAVLATAKNVRQLDHEKAGILARASKVKAHMTAMANKLNAVEVKLARKVGEQDKLFGSVTSKDVYEAVAALGFEIERKQIHLPDPLRTLGTHEVEVKLTTDVAAKLKVTIVAE
jgi:large subunit ribosomal protein L9